MASLLNYPILKTRLFVQYTLNGLAFEAHHICNFLFDALRGT